MKKLIVILFVLTGLFGTQILAQERDTFDFSYGQRGTIGATQENASPPTVYPMEFPSRLIMEFGRVLKLNIHGEAARFLFERSIRSSTYETSEYTATNARLMDDTPCNSITYLDGSTQYICQIHIHGYIFGTKGDFPAYTAGNSAIVHDSVHKSATLHVTGKAGRSLYRMMGFNNPRESRYFQSDIQRNDDIETHCTKRPDETNSQGYDYSCSFRFKMCDDSFVDDDTIPPQFGNYFSRCL